MADSSLAKKEISSRAEVNFREVAKYVVANMESLPLNLETATRLNRMLTKGLVPEDVRGQVNFRSGGNAAPTDKQFGNSPQRFYGWLASNEAKNLGKRDAVALAEMIHHNIAALDSFPDGNGRLSRVMADLALLRHGQPPVLYTSMKSYFKSGNARSDNTRAQKREYFKMIAERGRVAASAASKPTKARLPKILVKGALAKRARALAASRTKILTRVKARAPKLRRAR